MCGWRREDSGRYRWRSSGRCVVIRKVILFPDTDPDGIAFKRWSEAATLVMNQVFWEDSPPIRVSPLLETHATPEQKQAKIDLIDFLF